MLELILVLFIAIFLAWCLSKYLSKVMANQPMWGDGLFRWIENPVYRLLGVSPQQQMNWKQYSLALGNETDAFFMNKTLLANQYDNDDK